MECSPQDILRIISAGIDAVRPSTLFPSLFSGRHPAIQQWLDSPERYLFCVGKASAACATAILGQSTVRDYFVIAPANADIAFLDQRKIHPGSHPVPDKNSLRAGILAGQWLKEIPAASSLLIVISGGSSALMVAPWPGVSLESKMRVNRILLRSGASIQEMNTVRKHLSAIKGGRMADAVSHLHAAVLAISDVVGDDLATIGSGPFYPDPTTFVSARSILKLHNVWQEIPDDAREVLEKGCAGEIPETPKQFANPVPHHIIASNRMACQAAAAEAKRLGYGIELQTESVTGYVEEMAQRISAKAGVMKPGTAMIAGGEVTVKLTGNGTGGRNQHLAVLITPLLADKRLLFAAAGTDGIDGNSPAAGAWTDGQTFARAANQNLNIELFTKNFDSFHFFESLQQNIITGPTGTNVMDLYVLLS